MGIVILPPRNGGSPPSSDDPIASDEAGDRFADHVFGLCDRTFRQVMKHYRPFVDGRGYAPEAVTKFLNASIGGAFVAIGVRALKDAGFTWENTLPKFERAWREDDEERRAHQVSGGRE